MVVGITLENNPNMSRDMSESVRIVKIPMYVLQMIVFFYCENDEWSFHVYMSTKRQL